MTHKFALRRVGFAGRGLFVLVCMVLALQSGYALAAATPGSESSASITDGNSVMTTMTRNAMSSRSSSIQQSDGSRDDMREVRVSNDDWSVTVASTDHFTANAGRASHRLAIGVEDRTGRHIVVLGQPYMAFDGTEFTATGDGVHVVQHRGSLRQVTDITRENGTGRSSKLTVNQHSCYGDHCP